MKTRLRVLNVEDSVGDSDLMRRPFLAAGYEVAWTRIETAPELREALERNEWDVVLADYNMPQFDAVAALKIFQEHSLDIPFIVVSGAIGEDLGVSMMQAGAHDYVLKSQLRRLVPAVERELRETEVRRERRIAQQRLCESEHRFRQLAELTPNLVWQTDAAGRLEYANSQWRDYFGREAKGFAIEDWPEVIHPADAPNAILALEQAAATPDGLRSFEVRLRRHDGVYHWFVHRSVAARDAEGSIYHWVCAATNVDGLMQDAEALRRANAQLNQFAYAAAHDLLEPLRNISSSLGLLERMYERHPDGEARALIAEAIGDARRLHGMLRGLYELAKIDAADSEGASADARDTMLQVLANLRATIAESGAEVAFGPLPRLPVRELHLLQVLQNLIANSLKFRDQKRAPRVQVTVERCQHEWQFTVADNGVGFDPAQSPRIFDLFYRLDRDASAGLGVGLALCARIVASYGGRIWAEGRPGEGATFSFTLPAAKEAGGGEAAAKEVALAGA